MNSGLSPVALTCSVGPCRSSSDGALTTARPVLASWRLGVVIVLSGPTSQKAATAPATVAARPDSVSNRPRVMRAKRMKRLPLYDVPGDGRVHRTAGTRLGPLSTTDTVSERLPVVTD